MRSTNRIYKVAEKSFFCLLGPNNIIAEIYIVMLHSDIGYSITIVREFHSVYCTMNIAFFSLSNNHPNPHNEIYLKNLTASTINGV